MKRTRHDYDQIRGDQFELEVECFTKDGEAYDLENHTFAMQVRLFPESEDIVAEVPNEAFTFEGNLLTISSDYTFLNDAVVGVKYVYDVEVTNPQGVVQSPVFGKFKIISDVTR
jgi:hypothetical protein